MSNIEWTFSAGTDGYPDKWVATVDLHHLVVCQFPNGFYAECDYEEINVADVPFADLTAAQSAAINAAAVLLVKALAAIPCEASGYGVVAGTGYVDIMDRYAMTPDQSISFAREILTAAVAAKAGGR